LSPTAEAIRRLTRQTELSLKVESWRLFFHGATREQPDDHVIEVRCRLERPWRAGRIVIVGTPNEDLANLRVSLEIRSPQEKTPGGWLRYYPPISSADGVVDEKTGSVVGQIFYTRDTIREIAQLLTIQPTPDLRIGVTVNLDPETSQMHGDRRWDGKELLEIQEPVIVAASAPMPAPEPRSQPEESPILLVRTLANGVDKLTTLNTRIVNVSLFIAVIVVFILIELWRHHF
jgi:hypothetical protein